MSAREAFVETPEWELNVLLGEMAREGQEAAREEAREETRMKAERLRGA